MTVITGESLQNLTNIVNAVVINIDCPYVWVPRFHENYPSCREQKHQSSNDTKFWCLLELQGRGLFQQGIVPKCYWTIVKMEPLCAVHGALFSACIREGYLRSLWVLSRQPCQNDILTCVQWHSHYLSRGWNPYEMVWSMLEEWICCKLHSLLVIRALFLSMYIKAAPARLLQNYGENGWNWVTSIYLLSPGGVIVCIPVNNTSLTHSLLLHCWVSTVFLTMHLWEKQGFPTCQLTKQSDI